MGLRRVCIWSGCGSTEGANWWKSGISFRDLSEERGNPNRWGAAGVAKMRGDPSQCSGVSIMRISPPDDQSSQHRSSLRVFRPRMTQVASTANFAAR